MFFDANEISRGVWELTPTFSQSDANLRCVKEKHDKPKRGDRVAAKKHVSFAKAAQLCMQLWQKRLYF